MMGTETKEEERTGLSSSPNARLLKSVREALENSAAAKSVRGKIRLEVLFSIPKQARELYPYAHYDAYEPSKTARSYSIEAYVEHVFMTASYTDEPEETNEMNEKEKKGESRLMYALECFLYTLPKYRSALLYVSKLDSSGWGPKLPAKHLQPFLPGSMNNKASSSSSTAPLHASTSITRVITEAFIRHFASLEHWNDENGIGKLAKIDHLSLHILARAQGAYLFPSSNENKLKHILSDGQLIKWWRSVVTSVVRMARSSGLDDVRPFYIIPGYDKQESSILLPLPSANEPEWVYGHPYSLKGASLPEGAALPPLPLSGPTFGRKQHNQTGSAPGTPTIPPTYWNANHIATLLPYFPDDPKSRFIVELAQAAHEMGAMTNPATGINKRRAVAGGTASSSSSMVPIPVELNSVRETRASTRSSTPIGRRSTTPSTPPPTGSNRRANSRSGTSSPSPVKLTSSQRQGMRERAALDRVSPDEFWTRMAFRQECCSGNAVGVFVALFTRSLRQSSISTPLAMSRTNSNGGGVQQQQQNNGSGGAGGIGSGRSMAGQPLALPDQILQDIIFKKMMIDDCDWSKMDKSVELTKQFEHSIGLALQRKGNLKLVLGEERAEREMQQTHTRNVGKEIVWTEVDLQGPTKNQIQKAEEDWKESVGGEEIANEILEKQRSVALSSAADPRRAAIESQTVNVLPVKRKKKPVE